MKIRGVFDGIEVELQKPGPACTLAIWYEPVAYRMVKRGDYWLNTFSRIVSVASTDSLWSEDWIMRPIPRATVEQLHAIEMLERDKMPTEVHDHDTYWDVSGLNQDTDVSYTAPRIGSFRWILVPVQKAVFRTGPSTRRFECRSCVYPCRIELDLASSGVPVVPTICPCRGYYNTAEWIEIKKGEG
jgi:hypothetical protein